MQLCRSISVIFASGWAKSAGNWVFRIEINLYIGRAVITKYCKTFFFFLYLSNSLEVTEIWMPFVTGLIYVPSLLISLGMMALIPAPDAGKCIFCKWIYYNILLMLFSYYCFCSIFIKFSLLFLFHNCINLFSWSKNSFKTRSYDFNYATRFLLVPFNSNYFDDFWSLSDFFTGLVALTCGYLLLMTYRDIRDSNKLFNVRKDLFLHSFYDFNFERNGPWAERFRFCCGGNSRWFSCFFALWIPCFCEKQQSMIWQNVLLF